MAAKQFQFHAGARQSILRGAGNAGLQVEISADRKEVWPAPGLRRRRNVAAGASAVDLKRGLTRSQSCCRISRALSRPVTGKREKTQVPRFLRTITQLSAT